MPFLLVFSFYALLGIGHGLGHGTWLSPMFHSGVILQKAPQSPLIYGQHPDSAGDEIKLTVYDPFGDVVGVGSTNLGSNGEWEIHIPPQPAGHGYTIELELFETRTLSDVAFGDVWVCSGQSNMEFTMGQMFDAEKEMSGIINSTPQMRILHLNPIALPEPKDDFQEDDFAYLWEKVGDGGQSLSQFSSICALFGNYQQLKLGYPIGLIDSTWGGTFIEPWSAPEGLDTCGIPPDNQDSSQERNSYLFNSMIYPLAKFSIEGVIWYQGEQNAGYPGEYVSYNLDKYACAFRELIAEWRNYWYARTDGDTNPDFPFGFVQLAAFTDQRDYYTWPKLRYHQTSDYSFVPNDAMENTFMAVAMDTNDPQFDSLHPPHKREPAIRLAMAAYHQHYLESSFDQPRVLRACKTPEKERATFELSHQIQYDTQGVPKGFSACCENDYEKCNDRESWVDLHIVEVAADRKSVDVDLTPVYEHCPEWEINPGVFGYLWMETPCKNFLDCPLYVIGCNQLTDNCDDDTLKFPVTPWTGGFSDSCV